MITVSTDELEVRLLHPAARAPSRSRPHDAGYDLCAVEDVAIEPRSRVVVATGVAIALPDSVCALIVPRSGLAARDGVLPTTGLIDPNFRGELKVTLLNTGDTPFAASAGDRIAQLLLVPFWAPTLAVVDELPPSPDDRGTDGWGSSGR